MYTIPCLLLIRLIRSWEIQKNVITIILVQIQQLQLCKLLVYYAELELYTALAKLINFHNQI